MSGKILKITQDQADKAIKQLRSVFDIVRILKENEIAGESHFLKEDVPCKCYDFWKKNKTCNHCISTDTFKTKKDYAKIEFCNDSCFQVFTKYCEIDNQPYVMEMIKKLEDNTFIDPKGYNHLMVNLSSYNEKIYKDAVTGTLNRLYYEEKIKMETEPAGIAIIDIDNFKAWNDTYGHKAGDEVLKTVVNVISQNIREDDAVIRFGGDEFLIVLQGIKQKSFNPKLEHIRSMICSTVIPGFEKLRISISVGAVITDGESIESSVIKADQLMYRAKKKKNSIVTEWDLKPIELVDEEIENRSLY